MRLPRILAAAPVVAVLLAFAPAPKKPPAEPKKPPADKPAATAPNPTPPLDEDKALILEAKGLVTEEYLTAMAGKFDLAAVEKALGQPPRTDFNRSLEAFKALKKGIPLSEVSAWVGDGDADVGRSIHVLAYKLSDGSRVLLGFADIKNLLYVKHEKDGQTVDLVK